MRRYTNFGFKPPSAFLRHKGGELTHRVEACFPAAAAKRPRTPLTANDVLMDDASIEDMEIGPEDCVADADMERVMAVIE
jgi:hypothetical protein